MDRRAIQSDESQQPITPAQDAATSTYHAGVPTPPQDAGTPTHHGFVDRDERDRSGDSDEQRNPCDPAIGVVVEMDRIF